MHEQSEYSSVPIGAARALAGEVEARFAVFLPGTSQGRPVLYRDAGADLSTPDFERLADHGVSTLLVRSADLKQCEEILEAKLSQVLDNGDLGSEERAQMVYHVGTAVAHDLVRPDNGAPDLRRASTIVDNVISCVLSDPMIATHMLQMAEHERTTASHMFIVSALAVVLGTEVYGADREALRALGFAGMMHDIGKLAIDADIINKPTALTPAETHLIQQHPIESVRLLGDHPGAGPDVRRMILQHHERIDGRGYPLGIHGSQLSTGSRILTIVDSFHAMIGHRVYRKPFSAPEATRAMRAQAGRQFDADLLGCWCDLFERRWLGGVPLTQIENDATQDELSSRHEHRPTPPPPKMFGDRAKRFECDDNVTVTCVYAGRLHHVGAAPNEFVAPVCDISRSGLCIYSTHPMYRGEIIHIRMRNGTRDFWVRATIAWCRQHNAHLYRAGVRLDQRILESEAHETMEVRPIGELDQIHTSAGGTRAAGNPVHTPPLHNSALAPREQENPLDTLSAIGAMRHVSIEAERTVVALSASEDPKVRLAVVNVVMKIASKSTRVALLRLLRDREAPVRERAAIAAGALRMGEATSLLQQLLSDPDKAVALRAAGALGRLDSDEGLPLVTEVLSRNGPQVRLAATVLGDILGHRFAANAEGVKSARRYLSVRKPTLA
ncbi:MAG: HEAT repeat domain-containing protein [Planctomycetes bacterium]|nr:HEAT repeat domain-containing protein [Planctomycetota bacterium]